MTRTPADTTLTSIVRHLSVTLDEVVESLGEEIDETFYKIAVGLLDGRRLLICGNGGSAADAQHLAGELVSSFKLGLSRPALDAIALTVNSSVITAYVNDFDPIGVMARQVEAHGRSGDYLLCITTSGQSTNILQAAQAAVRRGLWVVGLTGRDGGLLRELADTCIVIPSDDTQTIQTAHLVLEHYLCEIVDSIHEARRDT